MAAPVETFDLGFNDDGYQALPELPTETTDSNDVVDTDITTSVRRDGLWAQSQREVEEQERVVAPKKEDVHDLEIRQTFLHGTVEAKRELLRSSDRARLVYAQLTLDENDMGQAAAMMGAGKSKGARAAIPWEFQDVMNKKKKLRQERAIAGGDRTCKGVTICLGKKVKVYDIDAKLDIAVLGAGVVNKTLTRAVGVNTATCVELPHLAIGPLTGKKVYAWYGPGITSRNDRARKLVGGEPVVGGNVLFTVQEEDLTEEVLCAVEKLYLGK